LSTDLIARLRSASADMTPALERVATAVLNEPDVVLYQSITELADHSKSSEATVMRFCRDLGFSGFQDFKLALARELATRDSSAQSTNGGDAVQDLVATAITALKETEKLISRLRVGYDLIKLALENDCTRVVSLFIQPLGVLSEIAGVSHETHSLTHHGNRPEMIEELRKIEEAQFTVFRDFLAGLRGVVEPGGGNLLERTSVLYGTCMGNANGHTNKNWPMLLAGGGFKHGQHLAFDAERNEPIGKLFVSLLQRLGIESDEFSSAKGRLNGLELA